MEDTPRTCGHCGVANIPNGVQWNSWRDGQPVHLLCLNDETETQPVIGLGSGEWLIVADDESQDYMAEVDQKRKSVTFD